MSETSLSPQEIAQSLQALLEGLRPILGGQGQVVFYEEVARRLSTAIQQDPPWGWRYIQGVEKGTIQPSRKLARAILALGATLDGLPAHVADTTPVQVYAAPGKVRPGSIILAASRFCARPGCPVSFVPVVPRQKYCCAACRYRARQALKSLPPK